MIDPWLGILLVLAIFGGLMATLQSYQRNRLPHPELTRKLLHVGMGLVTLTLPWLFALSWPVLFLAGVAVFALATLRRSACLQRHFGGVIDGVGRKTLGEIYFPLAVGALFLLSAGDPLLFYVPTLVLALADAAAALIGVRYGLLRYTTIDGEKSVEGSIAFFAIAFLSAHIPLSLFTDAEPAKNLLIALMLALILMVVEAIAWRGLDNLFVPLGAFVLLKAYLTMDVPTLTAQLAITVSLIILVLFWARRTSLNSGALLGAVVVGNVIWAAGGWRWLRQAYVAAAGSGFGLIPLNLT